MSRPAPSAPAPEVIAVDGHERLEWDQPGETLDEIKSYRYIALVGKTPKELKDVRCEAPSTTKGPFVCSGRLPPMDAGVHPVRVLSVAARGKRMLSSPWSAPLVLKKQ